MRYLLWVFILVLVMMIIYLSWISSPRLAWNVYVPNWIAHWADKQENDNFRTTVPFALLGLSLGTLIIFNKLSTTWWLRALLVQIVLVIIVEIGQLLRPLRSFDFMDIFWGVVGSGFGLITVYSLWKIFKKNNNG